MNKEKNSQKDEKDEIVDMNEAIKLLNTTRPTFYRWLRSGKIKGMKVGRQWRFYRSEIERFLKGEEPRIELNADIKPFIKILQEKARSLGNQETPDENADEVTQAVDLIIALAVKMESSDIHLANYIKDDSKYSAILRYRIDGVLYTIADMDIRLLPPIIEKWKTLAICDVNEHKKPQEGSIHANVAGKEIEMRVCFLPTSLGESIAVRILNTGANQFMGLSLDDLGFLEEDRNKILRCLKSPWGMIIVSGPTGSGKSTVLYVCLKITNRLDVNVITVEDPVEYIMPWTSQIPVQRNSGITFANVLRTVMISDPDVIMIGEIQDGETLSMAHNCALTGHLVLTIMHANGAIGTLKYMMDMGSNPNIIAESTKLIISQRLVRKLCPECSTEISSPNAIELAEKIAINGGLDWDKIPKNFREPIGCANCRGTGYKGRTVVAEILEITPQIVKAMTMGTSFIVLSPDNIKKQAVEQGMITMSADGIRKAGMGITSLSEVMRVTSGA
ncbi:MAG: ATPase, T2SS/T4P/T4SS family [Candidatus Poribacteria bacterium]